MANILVIGNGFDLYHGKRTSYSDFLDFLIDYKEKQYDKNLELTSSLQAIYDENDCTECESSLENYLLTIYRSNKQKRNWINLEKDIKEYVHRLTDFLDFKGHEESEGIVSFRESVVPAKLTADHSLLVVTSTSLFKKSGALSYKLSQTFIDPLGFVNIDKVYLQLEKELSCLSQILSLYLNEYEPQSRGVDPVPQNFIAHISPIKTISFNYTSTPSDIYFFKAEDILYVHGNLNNNIVLGYDDLDGKTDDLIFKKYYRRLVNDTDLLQGKDLLVNNMGFLTAQDIYMFGHSLDLSDEDYLRVIFDKAAKVYVFYLDEIDRANKISNIIKLLDKETAIKRIANKNIVLVKIPEYEI